MKTKKNKFDKVKVKRRKDKSLYIVVSIILSLILIVVVLNYKTAKKIQVIYQNEESYIEFVSGESVLQFLLDNKLSFDEDDDVFVDDELIQHSELDHIISDDVTKLKIDSIEVKTETTEVIDKFDTNKIETNDLIKDTTSTTVEGVDGIYTEVYEVTYRNGKVDSKVLIETFTITKKVDSVVLVGTRVEETINVPTTNTNSNNGNNSNSNQNSNNSNVVPSNPVVPSVPVSPTNPTPPKVGIFANLSECQAYGNTTYKSYQCLIQSDGSYNIIGQK